MKRNLSVVLLILSLTNSQAGQYKPIVNTHRILLGETFNYRAKWGFLTVGTATTKSDRKLYKIGDHVVCKIQLGGTTNGLARLFYLNDYWFSYIDIHSYSTQKAFRSIREGTYKLDEWTFFKPDIKKAEVWRQNVKAGKNVLHNVYKTPENIRDVVAGFQMIRLIDLSVYKPGEKFLIDGFYEDTGYKIDVTMLAKETVKTDRGPVLCYKINPSVPKNKVFSDVNAVDVWVAAQKPFHVVKIHARLILGDLWIDQI